MTGNHARLWLKDQLRMLLFGDDRDVALMAAAELLSRETSSSKTLYAADGTQADFGYDATGTVYLRRYWSGANERRAPEPAQRRRRRSR